MNGAVESTTPRGIRIGAFAVMIVGLVLAIWCSPTDDDVIPPEHAANASASANAGNARAEHARASGEAGDRRVLAAGQPGAAHHSAAASATPTWTIRIRVVDDTYTPIVGAKVAFVTGQRTGRHSSMSATAKLPELETDATGRVTNTVRANIAQVTATAEGFDDGVALLRAEDHDDEAVLVMPRPVTLAGMVRGADGEPLANATVHAWSASQPGFYIGHSQREGLVATTADDGTFALAVQLGSRYHLRAKADGASSFDAVTLINSRKPDPVELVMPGGITISGIVRSADGEPAIDGAVSAWRDGQEHEVLHAYTTKGRFRMELPAFAEYHVAGSGHGFASSEPLVVTPTPQQRHLQLTLELRPLVELRGRVVGADGKPREGVRVRTWCGGMYPVEAKHRPSKTARFGDVRDEQSAADGTFTFQVDPAARWHLEALAGPSNQDSAVLYDVAAPGQHELVIGRPQCRIRGHITSHIGRALGPCEALVTRVVRGGSISGPNQLTIDAQGYFELSPQPRGQTLYITIVPSDNVHGPSVVGPVHVDAEQLELEFPLHAKPELPVQVVDADGRPVPCATVRVRRAPHAPMHASSTPALTDLTGRTTLRQCVAGPGKLQVRLWGHVVATRDVEVGPGPNAPVVVHLER